MIDSYLRPTLQKKFIDNWISTSFLKNVHPIYVTIISCIIGLISSIFIFLESPLIALFFLLMSGLLDVLDGSIARTFQKTSHVGAVLDIYLDRVVEFSVIFALFFYDPIHRAIPTLLMSGGILLCVSSFLVVGVFSENTSEKSFHYSPGIIERAEAFLFFSCMILFPISFTYASYTFAFFMMITSMIRIYEFILQQKRL